MAYTLPEDIRKQAEKILEGHPHLKLLDPGTVLPIDSKIFVTVQDIPSQLIMWLKLPNR